MFFKSKRKKVKKSLMKSSKQKIFKSKLTEIKEILDDQMLDRDEKIEEIKKILYDPFKPKEDKPVRTGNAFSSKYIEYQRSGDKDKTLSIKDYLDEIKPYLSHINDHKTNLTIPINFFSSKDSDENRTMHCKSDNTEILIGNKTNEIFQDIFNSIFQRYKKELEKSMKGSEFVLDIADSLYYKLHKISLQRGGVIYRSS